MTDGIRITEIQDSDKKSSFTREVLEKLPEWFGIEQAVDEYVEEVREFPYWAAVDDCGRCLGFFSVRTHYRHTGDIFVCGVLPEYHRRGIGRQLYYAAEEQLVRTGCRYVIVKTLSDRADSEAYGRTREFYRSVGFEPLITLTEMWDQRNPCLIMLKLLGEKGMRP